jgi:hypothetical protein
LQNTNNNLGEPLNADKHFFRQFYTEELYSLKKAPDEAETARGKEMSDDRVISPLGDITSETLLLFAEPGNGYPKGTNKVLLDNILKAIGLNVDSVSWINTANYPGATWREFTLASNAAKIIVFGLPPEQSPGNTLPGQIYSFNGRRCIATLSLGALNTDTKAKKQFWGLLKELYVR